MEETLPLRERMNLETARIHWRELERYFAGGKVIQVAPALDLTEVAACLAEDNVAQVKMWMAAAQVQLLDDETAQRWAQELPEDLWAVVVAPWVLVQQRTLS
jgi:hypothetical protein